MNILRAGFARLRSSHDPQVYPEVRGRPFRSASVQTSVQQNHRWSSSIEINHHWFAYAPHRTVRARERPISSRLLGVVSLEPDSVGR